MSSLTPYTYINGFKSSEFHHAVLSISGTTHTLYLDGNVVQKNTNAPDILNTFSSVNQTVFGANYLLNQAFNGIIGDVRVYNKAISDTQVSNLYLNRNLIAHYPFDISVNNLTPNYATLQYDASFVGGATTISSTLNIRNSTTGAAASQYLIAKPGKGEWYLNSSTGITISCWINANSTTNTNKIMRIFDIPLFSGSKGVAVDISGTNAIYSSSYLTYTAQLFFPLTDNSNNYGRYTSFSSSNVTNQDPSGILYTSFSGKKCLLTQLSIQGLYNTNLFRNGYTLSFWVYIDRTKAHTVSVNVTNSVSISYTSSSAIATFDITTMANHLTMYTKNNYNYVSAYNIFNNVSDWYHLSFTGYNNGTYKTSEYYVNGNYISNIRDNRSTYINSFTDINAIMLLSSTIAYRRIIGCRYLTVFNSVFSQSQVKRLYNEQLKM